MKILLNNKDGGPKSRVWCYGIEFKKLFSVILLRFENGSREAYHSHAFNCLNWVLKGKLIEDRLENGIHQGAEDYYYSASFIPFIIKREHLHKVTSEGRTWVLSFRGPWRKTWVEYLSNENKFIILTHGRKEIG